MPFVSYFTYNPWDSFVDILLFQSDKEWYQDQAKKLKVEFKNKYPHYVYRRKSTRRRQQLLSNSVVGPCQ